MTVSQLQLVLPEPSTSKTQCFFHLILNSILQLINSISIVLQKLVKYFNFTANVLLFRSPLLPWATAFPNNSA